MQTTVTQRLGDSRHEGRARGRPKKKPRNSPEASSFEEIATRIKAIPKQQGTWYRAKEAALEIVAGDKDLLEHPSCVKLARAMLAQLNHDLGYDFGGRKHYASLCGKLRSQHQSVS